MNLIVDIGNSSVKVALFCGGEMRLRKRLRDDAAAQISQIAETTDIDACAYSVVGNARPGVEDLLHQISRTTPLYVKGTTDTPLTNDYHTPQTLGADRLAAAVGAAHLRPQSNLLVIDVGTCITYDYVSEGGHYLGGNISPGLGMRLRALNQQTAKLPLVASDGDMPAVGTTTETAIRTGVIQGIDFEICGYIQAMKNAHRNTNIFLTGGNSYRFAKGFDVERSDALVETGLNCILQYHNR